MSADETDEPTLRRGDQSADGWVEYLQQLITYQLEQIGVSGIADDGDFGRATHREVVAFQDRMDLAVDGIVGNQTWAALRGEVPQDPATDGRKPGTYVEVGVEARWFHEEDAALFSPDDDVLTLLAVNTGNVAITAEDIQLPAVTLWSGVQPFELTNIHFAHDLDRAEPGEKFLFSCVGISALGDGFVPVGLTVQATMTADYGGDILEAHVAIAPGIGASDH